MAFNVFSKLTLCFLIFAAVGCASSSPKKVAVVQTQIKTTQAPQDQSDLEAEALQNIEESKLQEYVQKKGVIFGKTDFQGVLKAVYVKLVFENIEDASLKYQLFVGDHTEEKKAPWKINTVDPGYFFIELPTGQYKIASVSIPVGSTQATEDIDVRFDVAEDTISYIGTLKMVGTKEKIKLGGVPVIRPGFEYTIEVLDEWLEGQEAFQKVYPDINKEIMVNIMKNAF